MTDFQLARFGNCSIVPIRDLLSRKVQFLAATTRGLLIRLLCENGRTIDSQTIHFVRKAQNVDSCKGNSASPFRHFSVWPATHLIEFLFPILAIVQVFLVERIVGGVVAADSRWHSNRFFVSVLHRIQARSNRQFHARRRHDRPRDHWGNANVASFQHR
jgi:hypothetical protein